VLRRLVRGSAHGRVKGRPGGGTNDNYGGLGARVSACGGANDDDNVNDARGGASMGALAPAVRKRRPVGGWPATVPTAMPAGAPMEAAAAK
jgi:hypothetical protein